MVLGFWYRQLMGESIGKKFDRSGGLVRIGMLPTVSQGSSDLHSVGQLYLAGPKNRFTTFVTVEHNRSDLVVPHEESMTKGIIKNGTFLQCMSAIAHGTMIVYQKEELPFVHLALPEKSAWYVGQFLQMKMIEIFYLGYLLAINPFDQPQVELYKRETRKLLSHE
jgi:glucose-6-phosphate isomerase